MARPLPLTAIRSEWCDCRITAVRVQCQVIAPASVGVCLLSGYWFQFRFSLSTIAQYRLSPDYGATETWADMNKRDEPLAPDNSSHFPLPADQTKWIEEWRWLITNHGCSTGCCPDPFGQSTLFHQWLMANGVQCFLYSIGTMRTKGNRDMLLRANNHWSILSCATKESGW